MKTKFIAATVVALAAMSSVSAFAQDRANAPVKYSGTLSSQSGAGDIFRLAYANNPQSTLTRAQVQAEYLQAQKDGTLPFVNEAGNPVNHAKAPAPASTQTLTRAEVRSEALAFNKLHRADLNIVNF